MIDEMAHNQLRKHNYESMTKLEGKHLIGKIRNDMINDVAKCYGILDLSDACMSPYLDKVEEIFNRVDNERSLSEILQQMLDETNEAIAQPAQPHTMPRFLHLVKHAKNLKRLLEGTQ